MPPSLGGSINLCRVSWIASMIQRRRRPRVLQNTHFTLTQRRRRRRIFAISFAGYLYSLWAHEWTALNICNVFSWYWWCLFRSSRTQEACDANQCSLDLCLLKLPTRYKESSEGIGKPHYQCQFMSMQVHNMLTGNDWCARCHNGGLWWLDLYKIDHLKITALSWQSVRADNEWSWAVGSTESLNFGVFVCVCMSKGFLVNIFLRFFVVPYARIECCWAVTPGGKHIFWLCAKTLNSNHG